MSQPVHKGVDRDTDRGAVVWVRRIALCMSLSLFGGAGYAAAQTVGAQAPPPTWSAHHHPASAAAETGTHQHQGATAEGRAAAGSASTTQTSTTTPAAASPPKPAASTPPIGSGVAKSRNTPPPRRSKADYAAKAKRLRASHAAHTVTAAQRQAAATARARHGYPRLVPTAAGVKKAADTARADLRAARATTGSGSDTTGATGAKRQAARADAARPGGTTQAHFYGPYANYANSPWRMPDPTVTIDGDGTGATAAAEVDLQTGAITRISMLTKGQGYTTATVTVTSVGTGTVAGTGAGASATATVDPATQQVTGVTLTSPGTGYVTPGVKKFVDTLPGLGEAGRNDLGQYIPVAQPDTTTYAGDDYYEIAVVEYAEKVHRDLPAARMRGYVQLSTSVVPGKRLPLTRPDGSPVLLPNGDQAYAVDAPHQYGPFIQATKDKAVRVLFRNLLATGTGGNLRLPVDQTVMGAGMGPQMGGMAETDPQNPMCGEVPKPRECFAENRATIHLHGGITPWISDGTPHQWITPAGEDTAYPKGVSVKNVPDMPDPGPGAQTFFYTNQQSARLMFFHDHAWGITRLNVYAGMSAGYSITDPTEKRLKDSGVLPSAELPLILSDKTFVPDTNQLAATDPLWDGQAWGGLGSLWSPHVYMPAQMPSRTDGVNPFGRWAYSPFFWPPPADVKHGPVANAYYDPTCVPADHDGFCEPKTVPGTPTVSMGMEAFNDTPLVNGTAYPSVTLDPKAYRLRILNAASDRSFNLSLYQADSSGTEVALKASEVAAAKSDPAGVVPSPDTAKSPAGPDWIQVGTDGGFLPAPARIPAQPITWVTDPTVFNAGNVKDHSLLMAPAERTDVVVDLSKYAGKTLILYNDSPAAFPARDPRYDYYTDNADLTSSGGAPTTPKGYGPNTRTVMQIKVAATTPAPAYDVSALEAAFAHHSDGSGVFESSQNPIVVGQAAYNSAYGTTFGQGSVGDAQDGFARITDFKLTFDTLSGKRLTDFPFQSKAIQDETGEAYDKDYGRMSGNLGLERPFTSAGTQQNLTLYPYVNPATELLAGVPNATKIDALDDGTQIWKITHNGVDTHPIHIHLLDFQLINRVGWDGAIRPPDANEVGWQDTIRTSPLEDTIVAVRPILPKLKFGVPDSIRPLDPSMPLGTSAQFQQSDAFGNAVDPPITNALVNFGWEYVWHCHILSHEEMDMMRPISVTTPRTAPGAPTLTMARASGSGPVRLEWSDPTPAWDKRTAGDWSNEVGFRVERAPLEGGQPGAWSAVGTALANATTYTDALDAGDSTAYAYRVVAWNATGESASAPVTEPTAPLTPAGLTASAPVAGGAVQLAWQPVALAERYVVERATSPDFTTGLTTLASDVTDPRYADASADPDTDYVYRVKAVNGVGDSGWSDPAAVHTLVVAPATPGDVVAKATTGYPLSVTVSWSAARGASGYEVQRADDPDFTTGLTTLPVQGTSLSVTDTTVVGARTYSYRVRATGSGPASGWATTTVTTPSTALLAVAGLSAQVSPTGSTPSVDLAWTPQPWATTYRVQRATNLSFTTGLVTVPDVTGRTLTMSGLTVGTSYKFRVRAEAPGATPGPWSPTLTFTPRKPLAPASLGLSVTYVAPRTATVTVRWTKGQAAPVGGYVLQRSTSSSFPSTGTVTLAQVDAATTSYADKGLARNVLYYYRVAAVTSAGSSPWKVGQIRTPQ